MMTGDESALGRLSKAAHVLSAYWVLLLALIIFVDVSGRYLFNSPLMGSVEIIKNSVVSITFLQLPLAIYRNGMIRTTLIYDAVGPTGQRLLRSLTNILGLAFFLATAYASWEPALEAWGIGEYEGEGALRVPTYPVRFLVVLTSAFTGFIYLYLLYLDWTGRLDTSGEEVAGV